MIKGFENGDIAVGFAVTGEGNKLVERLFHDTQNVGLVRLSEGTIVRLRGDVFERGELIRPDPTDLMKKEVVPTLQTRAVLVTTSGMSDAKVEEITKAIAGNVGLLNLGAGDADDLDARLTALATPLDSIPLHEGARAYYEERGLLRAAPTWLDKLEKRRTIFGIFQWIVIAVVGGLLSFAYVTWPTRRKAAEILRLVRDDEKTPEQLIADLNSQRDRVLDRTSRNWLLALLPGAYNLAQYRMLTELIDGQLERAEERIATPAEGPGARKDDLVAPPAPFNELSSQEVEQLFSELESKDAGRCHNAVERLEGLRGREAASEAVLSAFYHEDDLVRSIARSILRDAGRDAVQPLSHVLATHNKRTIRYAALWALRALVWELGPEPVSSAVPTIVKALHDKSTKVREEAEAGTS